MIITRTPLRISLLGGNTDFPNYYKKYGGVVLSTSIDKYIYCIVQKRFDDKIYINYSIKEIVDKVEDIKHDLVRECLKLTEVNKGIEITFLSDIPSEGSGLGSSSAVTVGLLNALFNYKQRPVSLPELASMACRIEIDILKKPIGVQDQLATTYGGLRCFRLFTLVEIDKVRSNISTIHKLDDSLMLFYTQKSRKAGKILKNMKLDKKILDKNKKLAEKGAEMLNSDSIDNFGDLLHKYWLLKKKLNTKVTNEEIDLMYKVAKKHGAKGGKIVGAGGGGFLLLFVPENKRESVRKALSNYQELNFRFEDTGTKVIFNI